MDPNRVNIYSLLRKFKNCVTCQEVSTDSESDDEERDVQDVSTDSDCDVVEEEEEEKDILYSSETDEVQGLSHLHLAAKRGDTEAIRSLLISSANVDVHDTKQNTPLHIATINGHDDVVDLLLNKNASVNSRNAFGRTSLHLVSINGHLATAQLLLKSNADVNAVCRRQATPLHLAAKRGHSEIVKNLIFNGVNVNACNNAKKTALHLASRNGHTSIVQVLLDNHATVDVMKQSKTTPFYLAAKNGRADISDLLLSRGVCDFVVTFRNATPLHVAVKENHTNVVEVILKHNRRFSSQLAKDRQTFQENAKNLIEIKGVLPTELLRSDGRCVSAGLILADKSKPLEIWEDIDRHIALEFAVRSTQPKMVQLLLNADPCVYSVRHLRSGFDCLIGMIRNCDKSANVESHDENYDMHCESIKEIAYAIINSSKFNVNHQYGQIPSPLHEVLYNLYISRQPKEVQVLECINSFHTSPATTVLKNYLIKLLLEKGADINMKNFWGQTPLIMASLHGGYQAIQILFESEHKSQKKLDVDARDKRGATALIKAAERKDVSVMRLLINHKAFVNMCDYYGFTALHTAIYEPNRYWFDLHFFCKGLHEISSRDKLTWEEETIDPNTVIDQIENYLEYKKETTRLKEEVVKLLLANDKTDVNVTDFRGNTPLDLAVKSSNSINSATFEALKNRGAIRKLKEPEDEAPIEVARIDERGRNPLHRLIICRITNNYIIQEQDDQRFDLMVFGILLRPENFRESATATDNQGRTPLHYAVMLSSRLKERNHHILSLLLKVGSNLNAADMYGKTPLHYTERNDHYELLVQKGADENAKDHFGNTPRDLEQLRESVIINEDNAKKLPIGKKPLYASRDFAQVLNINHVTKLSKRKVVELIRIYSQSPRPQESAEKAIWKIWTENELNIKNRRLSQLKPLIKHFIERLADGIKEKDWRFECQSTLVGSADEETKAVISSDFDFNFKLNKFSQFCDPFPHQLGPKGYFQLRRKPNEDIESWSDEKFDSFFNSDQCLLTNEINSRFKIILREVLSDPSFWLNEHHFDWNVGDQYKCRPRYDDGGLCATVELRMIHPIYDGEGGFLFVNISIDIVACVHVGDWWSEDPLPVGISPAVQTDGCTFVFDRPR